MFSAYSSFDAFNKATPPPGTIPPLSAAFVAYIASSTLSFFSFNSTFESAPTLITPTEPDRIAKRSSSFFLMNGFLSSLAIRSFTCCIRSFKSLPVLFTVNTVESSLVIVLVASPKQLGSMSSKSSPSSSDITLAPVTIAKSSTVSSLVGPKPGRSMKLTLILPLTLFVNKAAVGCCSREPMISKGRFFLITYSKIFCIFLMLGIADFVINIKGFSSSQTPLSLSLIK